MTEPRKIDFRRLPDLAARALGGSVIATNNEFYGDVHRLVAPGSAGHDPDLFADRGKVYDGWETRRRRGTDADGSTSDWAIVRLAVPGVLHGVNIDTSWFKGNYPPQASVEAAAAFGYPSLPELLAADWQTVVDKAELEGDSANVVPVEGPARLVTHLRLVIHPDGGVARFRAFGEVVPDPRHLGGRIDLAAISTGGRVEACSNMFYSSPANVLMPGVARIMSEGWETARRRDDGNDWLTVQLATPGELHEVVIDTSRFVGNAPGWATLRDADTGATLLERVALQPDTEHRFRLLPAPPVRTVRLDIFPDGGISRLRVRGSVPADEHDAIARRWLDLLPPETIVDPSTFFA